MKKTLIAFGLVLASPLTLLAEPEGPKLEVLARSVTEEDETSIFVGNAVAKFGDISVQADKIVFDRKNGLVTFIGEAKIKISDTTFTGAEVIIDIKRKKLTIGTATIPLVK